MHKGILGCLTAKPAWQTTTRQDKDSCFRTGNSRCCSFLLFIHSIWGVSDPSLDNELNSGIHSELSKFSEQEHRRTSLKKSQFKPGDGGTCL